MRRFLFLVITITLVIIAGTYLVVRSVVPRGVKVPDAVPVTNPVVPEATPAVQVRTESVLAAATDSAEVRFPNEYRLPDGSVSFRYPDGWELASEDPGEGVGAYGPVIGRFRLTTGLQNGVGEAASSNMTIEGEISEVSDPENVSFVSACEGAPLECGQRMVDGVAFTKAVYRDGDGSGRLVVRAVSGDRFIGLTVRSSPWEVIEEVGPLIDGVISSFRMVWR